jgi:hypothetical protein
VYAGWGCCNSVYYFDVVGILLLKEGDSGKRCRTCEKAVAGWRGRKFSREGNSTHCKIVYY